MLLVAPVRRLTASRHLLRWHAASTAAPFYHSSSTSSSRRGLYSSSSEAHDAAAAARRASSDPLRILFCGSDEFSCAALRALHEEKSQRPGELVDSIDVVVRPAKPTGRGLKTLREVPLKVLARELALPVHERDTFTGWEPPPTPTGPINLIIAVSFGLFVPPRLLRQSRYGGLNIHPSLLPDLGGPAPIQHALLRGDAHAGLTLQTLDHAAFDHGRILAQTRHPVPDGGCTTTARLTAHLAPLAADLLLSSLRAGLHVPPLSSPVAVDEPRSSTATATGAPPLLLQAAPKITKADLQVPWTSIAATGAGADAGAEAIARRERALGPLWTRAAVRAKKQNNKNKKKDKHAGQASQEVESTKRLILEGLEAADLPPAGPLRSLFFSEGGAPPAVVDNDSGVQAVTFLQEGAAGGEQTAVALPVVKDDADGSLLVPLAVPVRGGRVAELAGGECLRIKAIRVEGDKTKPAAKAIEAFIEDVKSLRSRGRELAMDLVTREVK